MRAKQREAAVLPWDRRVRSGVKVLAAYTLYITTIIKIYLYYDTWPMASCVDNHGCCF